MNRFEEKEIPKIEIPEIEAAEIEIPEIEVPEIEVPEIKIPNIEEKPHKKWNKMAVSLAVCFFVLTVVISVFVVKAYYSDERKLWKGFLRLAEEIEERQELWEQATGRALADGVGALKLETIFNVSGEALPYTFGIDTTVLRNPDTHKMRSLTRLSVMNNKLAELEVYGEDEIIMAALPDFWEQNLVFGTKRIDRQYNESLLAEKFGRIENYDLSIELFPEEQTFFLDEEMTRWEDAIRNLLKKQKKDESKELAEIQIEKLEKLKEISITFVGEEEKERKYQCSQYRMVITPDIRILISLDKNNRIIQILLEEPLYLPIESKNQKKQKESQDIGQIAVMGNICFVGEARSIDDIIVNMKLEVPQQILQIDESILSSFGNKSSTEEEKIEMQAVAEIVSDENDTRVMVDFDKMTLSVNRIGTYKLTGEASVEPLEEDIKPLEGETIQLFEITEEEYEELEEQLMKKLQRWMNAYEK